MNIIRKIASLWHRKKPITHKNSITGRNHTFDVPYLAKLEGDLNPGQSLVIRGNIITNEGFVISLTSGPRVEFDDDTHELDDRLLIIKVDIQKRRIFLNACINNEYGKEGIIKHKWKVGDEFDIRIRSHEEEFEIFLDHKLSARFAHYLPLSKVSNLFINGGINLFSIEWAGTYYQTPYAAEIPDKLRPKEKIYISGLCKKKAKQFFVDFLSGQDIIFRMDVRFPSKKIICNSRINDTWDSEQTIKPFLFKATKAFDLLIYVNEDKFMIYFDDVLLGSFEHRVNPRSCEKIQIYGDVVLQGVHLK